MQLRVTAATALVCVCVCDGGGGVEGCRCRALLLVSAMYKVVNFWISGSIRLPACCEVYEAVLLLLPALSAAGLHWRAVHLMYIALIGPSICHFKPPKQRKCIELLLF